MNWSLHHVNVNAINLQESVDFYQDIIGLNPGRTRQELLGDHNPAKSASRALFFGQGYAGLHVGLVDPLFSKRQNMHLNPTLGGHVAIQVADLNAVRRRLDKAGIVYSNGVPNQLPGLDQIYLYDPALNMLEINQDTSIKP